MLVERADEALLGAQDDDESCFGDGFWMRFRTVVAVLKHEGIADRIIGVLYERLNAGHATRAMVLHTVPNPSETIEVVQRVLWPFDFRRFRQPVHPNPPLVTLPPRRLLALLAEEYIYAQLCETIMLSYAAENEARMRAMIAARTNVHNTLDGLIGDSRRLRQEEITSEIVELSSVSLAAGAIPRKRKPGAKTGRSLT